jgi:hypothetical protein
MKTTKATKETRKRACPVDRYRPKLVRRDELFEQDIW